MTSFGQLPARNSGPNGLFHKCALCFMRVARQAAAGLLSSPNISRRVARVLRSSSPMHSEVGAPAGPALSKVPGTRVNPWGQQDIDYKYPPLPQDLTTDVCVIGAGVAGLTTAYRLAKAGKSVVVLESRSRAAGQSGKGLGMISTWNNSWYKDIIPLVGVDKARLVHDAHSAALDFVYQTIKEENIDCGFEQVPGYLMAQRGRGEWADKEAVQRLKKESEACSIVGMFPPEHGVKPLDLPVGGATEAVEFMHCANIHPVRYLEGLAEACVRRGVRIFENTRAKGGLITGPSKGRVQTMSGHTVTATQGVVLATHSPINRDQAWVHNRQLPWRVYTIGMEVASGTVKNYHYYDTSDNSHFVRVVRGGGSGGQDLLLVQGARHHQGIHPSRIGNPWSELEVWARRHFSRSGRVTFRWSTQDYFPADLLGLYGVDPIDYDSPHNYILTGHANQEWAGATLGSQIVSDLILGRPNAWSGVYKPSRVLVPATTRYLSELTQYFTTVGLSIVKHLVPRSIEDVKGLAWPPAVEDDLAPGEGKVVQHGWRKKAFYRDTDGGLHVNSALCTHLGCCVEWNPLDKVFDCPCHGSQFDTCGRCIHAPAVGDLEDLGGSRTNKTSTTKSTCSSNN